MKVTSMKTVMKRLAFPLLLGGVLWSGGARADDIVSIKSDVANHEYNSSGETIDFKITLAGYFVLTNAFGGSEALKPEIRMVVNGDIAYATLYSLSQSLLGGAFPRTDCIFRYRVKPGDMAQPLKIYGSPTIPYQFYWNSWAIRSATNLNLDAVWKFDPTKSQSGLGEVYDLTLANANITIRTLSFEDTHSPASVAATETTSWRVTSVNPTESSVVSFYVWTPGTNIVQIGSVPNQTWLLVQMPTNTVYKDFTIKGLAVGSTTIYLQRPIDYANNFTSIGVTNFIKKTITVTTPPEPTVRVIMTDTMMDNITLPETTSLNTGSFEIQLSEAFSNDMWVRIDSSPVGQSNVTFASTPFLVKVPSGSDRSSIAKFNVPDGTSLSAGAGIVLTPVVVSNAAAIAYYTRLRDGRVYVQNVKPVITQPLATDTPTAVQHASYSFAWNVYDVTPDMASGMTLTWIFGDGTTNYTTHGSVGTVPHTYTTTGPKLVKVRARDKDGTESDEVQFTVTVTPPVPQPHVRLSPNVTVAGETAAANTASFNVYLSEPYSTAVDIRLVTDPLVQSNIVFASTNVFTIPSGQTNAPIPRAYSLRDGTDASASTGIKVTPVVVNAASSYFTEMREAYVFLTNIIPVVTYPIAGDILAPANPPYDAVPMGTPFVFDYIVQDVPADQASMRVRWSFGDGATATVTGSVGSVSHTYTSLGNKYVWVEAEDKDGGVSMRIQFKVLVVAPPPEPTVSILPPAGPLSESIAPRTGAFTVKLSEAFTNAVTVQLTTAPVNSLANGSITLDRTSITFPIGETEIVVKFSAVDGTDLSYANGFTVTPRVVSSPTAVLRYTGVSPAMVEIMNVNPVINDPVASDTTQGPVYQVAQGSPQIFTWDVSDVANDRLSSPAQYAMSNTWYFGDNSSATVFGGAGSISHTYTIIGEVLVHFIARDKDGGFSEVRFKIEVLPAKAVNVTPIGPNVADYYGMRAVTGSSPDGGGGIGFGMVNSLQAQAWENRLNVYFFRYTPSDVSATLEANPYKTRLGLNYYQVTNYYSSGLSYVDPTRYLHDSFFFVWMAGEEQGIATAKLDPSSTTAATTVALPTSTDTGAGTEIRDVSAVFSREYYIQDNVGDINADGIPDDTVNWIRAQITDAGGGTDTGTTPTWLDSLNGYNDDYDKVGGTAVGDFLPINPNTMGARGSFDFRPIADPNTTPNGLPVNAFTAILEVRGYHKGLNRSYGLPDYGPGETMGDEPRTNPTLVDTDGDGLPDGWEYWFWYQAMLKGMTGSSYNPANVAVGLRIDSSAIAVHLDPLTYNADEDLDNDGLRTVEELTIGTNPVNWDTDGDGMCDGYEISMSLNPTAADYDPALSNPDGDYMAYASVPRELVTVVRGAVTNTYLTAVNTTLQEEEEVPAEWRDQFTTVYHYGDDAAPLAVGRRVAALAANTFVTRIIETNVLVLHFQVLNEFGFDPRTAWQGSMNFSNNRFPGWVAGAPNTRPFTAYDEYLLIKFMSENAINGAGPTMAPNALTWGSYSTHPFTPNTDYNYVTGETDGMPDGWELYVGIQGGLDMAVAANRTMIISPWNWRDGTGNRYPADATPPRDGLINLREFAGTESSFAYSNPLLYGESNAVQVVSIVRPVADESWFNKFWPTNPWEPDTDGDGLSDSAEQTFIYGTQTDNLTALIQGGGLNPNAIDTDLDALPDKWENEFAGTAPGGAGPFSGIVITNGMDGTVVDYVNDWDADGLRNFQEYAVQGVRTLRYDIPADGTVGPVTGNDGLPMDESFRTYMLYIPVTNSWDLSMFPWGDTNPQLWVMLAVGSANLYVSTDPRNPDTDFDSMDDYYEMFHGLNPILGNDIRADYFDDRIERAYLDRGMPVINAEGTTFFGNDWGSDLLKHFVSYPWLTGMPEADPDADGLLNLEEQLLSNMAAPENYNTDPTPLWLTDAGNPESVVLRCYRTYYVEDFFAPLMYFWPWNRLPLYMYGFEMNEGYDTDNDGVSDKAELVDSRNPMSSPQDHDDPLRRQALWFSGTNSAASTVTPYNYISADDPQVVGDSERAFRSFTLEMWARPERVMGQSEQVLIERAFDYGPSDASTTNSYVRRNYQIGITTNGHVYAKFDNAGADTHDAHTAVALAVGHILQTNTWVHIAARMDGRAQTLTLFVNGEIQDIVATALVPANGIVTIREYPTQGTYLVYKPGWLTLGAANDVSLSLSLYTYDEAAGEIYPDWSWPQQWAGYSRFYRGWIDEVRVWDGARENEDIRSDFTKRYTHNDLWENRAMVAERIQRGYTREATDSKQLPPLLLHHYTFDNLFGAIWSNSVALAPRGFSYVSPRTYVTNIVTTVETNFVVNPDLSVTTNTVTTVTSNTVTETFPNVVDLNRPLAPGAEVPWWSRAEVSSTVYTNYNYLPWIENGVDHLPIFGYSTTNSEGVFVLYMTNAVRDSVFWTHTTSGTDAGKNTFPNRCDPYGFYYVPWHYTSGDSVDFARDLLPLGDAFARQADVMWDDQGPAGAWLETGVDSDTDGLPDWWENLVRSRPEGAGLTEVNIAWDEFYPDGSGMTYGQRYQRDVAQGWIQDVSVMTNGVQAGYVQRADSDADGMPDWWERLYNLNYSYPDGAKGRDGAGGDPDLDGLSNLAEFQISEVYTNFNTYLSPLLLKSSPTGNVTDYFVKQGALTYGAMFSDHDFMEDSWEDLYHPYYVNRFVYDPTLDYDEDGWSNWAECRYERNGRKSDPSLGMHLYPGGQSAKDFPVPVVETRISYDGIQPLANIVVHAYSDPEMDGQPDAVFNLPAPGLTAVARSANLGFWGSRKVTGYLSPGSLVPGSLEMEFTDVSPDGNPNYPVRSAYDRFDEGAGTTGDIIGVDGSGWETPIGTIDYATGYYEIDLTWYDGITIVEQISATQTIVVEPISSYIVINYEVSQTVGWPKKAYFTDANMGYLREGANYFFAYMDLNANAAWDAGEPCGVATPFMTDINWDYNHVNIELTDYTLGYLRMTIAPPARSEDIYWGTLSGGAQGGGGGGAANPVVLGLENHIRVRRTVVDGWTSYQKIVLDKVLDIRTHLHEGDVLAQGDLALDWGLEGVPTTLDRDLVGYEVFVGNSSVLTNNSMVLTFTNRFDVEQAKAACAMPINGAYVYSSRPTFRWTMPEGYTAFAIEVRKGSPTGPQVYWSGEQQAPVRDEITGECVWEAPIHADSKLKNGQIFTSNTVYAWRVTALNAKFTLNSTLSEGCAPCGDTIEYFSDTVWSNWKMFRLDVNSPMDSSGYGEVRAAVKYLGTATQLRDRVKVQVFNNRGFRGVPAAQVTLRLDDDEALRSLTVTNTMPVLNAFLRGLAPSSKAGNYYVRAFIDSNMNDVRDEWESWGYANYYTMTEAPYNVRSFAVEFENQFRNLTAQIYIEDADTDQDWFPDVWEYEKNPTGDFLGLTGPIGEMTAGNTEINPGLETSGAFWGTSVFSVLALGTTDQDGDGLNDMAELMLGTDATGASTLGDGYTDGDKVSLGLAPQDALTLALTDLGVGSGGAAVQWKLDVLKDASVNRALLSSLVGVSGDGTVNYYIDYSASLLNPAWTTVRTGSVTLDGSQTFEGQIDTSMIDLSKGFFRVRLAK